MPFASGRITARKATLTLLAGYLAYSYYDNRRLVKSYPSRPPTGAYYTAALLTPRILSRYNPPSYTDVFVARVPRRALLSAARRHGFDDPTSLNEAWARIFLESPKLSFEAKLYGILKDRGDTGASGFYPGQVLLNGTFVVEKPPSKTEPLVISWHMPESVVGFFEALASAGYPWRVSSGGRHSIGVVEIPDSPDEVELVYGCGDEYERCNRVNGKEDGKLNFMLWTEAQKKYERRLLDDAVRQVLNEAGEK
ncbi:hypothetical protein OE88DRAFT_1523692 [Heliocybe sulcata]|uniref:Uncharacterized protein n=1 Tax=Heliocybe sulcata TaxID=5364 RepID=A0A5C3NBL1_9AGAM|nr:hypothetical protein OE88DRAFT_1523692 [Heliocybe sulcata]